MSSGYKNKTEHGLVTTTTTTTTTELTMIISSTRFCDGVCRVAFCKWQQHFIVAVVVVGAVAVE